MASHFSCALALVMVAVTTAQAQVPANPILWLRADSGVTASNNSVSRWGDVSGHDRDAWQDSVPMQPLLVRRGANDLPVLRFNGASFMIVPSAFPTRQDYSLTFVIRLSNAAVANNVLSGTSHAHWFGGNAFPKILHGANFSTQVVSSVPVTAWFNVVTLTYSNARGKGVIYVNGFFADSATIGTNTDSTIFLGAYRGASRLNGDLAELILYDRELSESQRTQLQNGLIRKWGVPVPEPFAPPAPGPILWLKADSGIVADTSGGVSHWLDRSGNDHAAWQDTPSRRPLLIPRAIDTMPALRFNGASSFMEASPAFPDSSDYSLLFVARINNLAASNNVVSGTTHAHYFGGSPYARLLHGANFPAQGIATIPIVANEFTVVTMTFRNDRGLGTIYINGNLADSALVGRNLDSTLYLGAYRRGNLLNGDLAEVLLYDRELSDPDRLRTETYLFRKYGIPIPPQQSRDTTFTEIPAQMQFFARGPNDSATVPISGAVTAPGYDSLTVQIYRDSLPWKRIAVPLHYNAGRARFSLNPTIHAERAEYRLDVRLRSASVDSSIALRDSIVCGDVIFIDGQSNSIYGNRSSITWEFCRTFGHNFSQSPRDTLWSLARSNGNGGGSNVGAWGIVLGKMLSDFADVPICIINGGVGGTTIEQHRRDSANPENLSTIYGSMLYRARKSGLSDKANIMLWYQGESNSGANYYDKFVELYNNWRRDYSGLRKIYVVQIRPGCGSTEHSILRETLRTLPDSLPDAKAYSPMGVEGHDGCHYAPAGYDTIGAHLFRILARDFYRSADTVDIDSPDLVDALFADTTYRNIALIFSNAVTGLFLTPDTTMGGIPARITESFFINDTLQGVSGVRVSGDTIYLALDAPYPGATISYIPDKYYPGSTVVYEGPWIRNGRGLGAFSFHRIPVRPGPVPASVDHRRNVDRRISIRPSPASTVATVSFTIDRDQRVEIALFNSLGVPALRVWHNATAGVNDLHLNIGQLPDGAYCCAVQGNVGILTTLLVVRR